uniref:Uncharacterized protein n=1 Tax=Biomphalaria glabrata TaxID=6526 RepID=A0A2C9KWK2_BIOGL
MDCVTCILMGMCLLCEPGIGGSNTQAKLDSGTDAPGRSLTQEEVANALQKVLIKYKNDIAHQHPRAGPNNRRSFIPDLKFSNAGIGKRNDFTEHLRPASSDCGQTSNKREKADAVNQASSLVAPLISIRSPKDYSPLHNTPAFRRNLIQAFPETFTTRMLMNTLLQTRSKVR